VIVLLGGVWCPGMDYPMVLERDDIASSTLGSLRRWP